MGGQGHQETSWEGDNVLYFDRNLGDKCMQLSKYRKCTLKIYRFHCEILHPEKKLQTIILNDILMLKYLQGHVLISAIYFEMYKGIKWVDGWIDGKICDKGGIIKC